MSWLKSIWRRFVSLFGPDLADLLTAGISAAGKYLPEIYQVVKWVAMATPTRADDEIIRVAEKLGVPAVLQGDRGEALAQMVLAWAQRKWPNAPMRQIRRAIEIAYGALKP